MMKSTLTMVCLALAFFTFSCKSAQPVTETPEYKSAKQDLVNCQNDVERLQMQLQETEAMLTNKDQNKGQMQAKINQLQDQLATTQRNLDMVSQQMQETSDDYGIWFRVQIGAYEQDQIDESLQTTNEFGLEGDGLQKIVLGRFRNYDNAKRLQTHLQKKGLKDAWIVSYRDGVRVPIEEVKN
jgi:septal ring factor EnvC (AmiA/AmiB activator)